MTTTLNMVKTGKYANGKCHQINQVQVPPTAYHQSSSNSGTFSPFPPMIVPFTICARVFCVYVSRRSTLLASLQLLCLVVAGNRPFGCTPGECSGCTPETPLHHPAPSTPPLEPLETAIEAILLPYKAQAKRALIATEVSQV